MDPVDPELLLQGFRLISIGFKEASLDSPSFRASTNHLDSQLNNIANWSNALADSIQRLPPKIQDLRATMSLFSEYLIPAFANDGILDQETTVPLLHSISHGYDEIFRTCFTLMSIETQPILEAIDRVNLLLVRYHTLRPVFDSAQAKYDKYYAIYMGNSKTKQPHILVEDAWQLYRTRKAYLHASLDLIRLVHDMARAMDYAFIELMYKLWGKVMHSDSGIASLDSLKNITFQIQRTKAWASNGMLSSIKDEIELARSQIETKTSELIEPSTLPDDYKALLINKYTLNQIVEPSCEKHGYVMMKTWHHRSTKPIWVKRWAFIKNGVFGMLVLSPSKTFVQETDKLGVLLLNIRYAAQEDRGFCFEIKTSDQAITLQAESLIDLKSWLKVFDNEKNRVWLEGEGSILFKVASTRYPPLITEFASTALTTVDRQLSNSKIRDENGELVESQTLSSVIKENEKYFQHYLYSQIPLFKPPLNTSNTKSAIIANFIANSAPLPSALTANLWGSVNWGVYYLQRTPGTSPYAPTSFPNLIKRIKWDPLLENYPSHLISQDVEMRSLFENEVSPDEFCLLSFTCLWSPNSNQQLCTRLFISDKSCFLYNQASGFRSLFRSCLSRLVAVDFQPYAEYDELKLHIMDDILTIQLYLDKGELMHKKLEFIISNYHADHPLPAKDIIDKLCAIDKQFEEEQKKPPVVEPTPLNSIEILTLPTSSYKTDYYNNYQVYRRKSYQIPAKALFHVMFGDSCDFIKDSNGVVASETTRYPWVVKDGKLTSQFECALTAYGRNGQFNGEIVVENLVENKYYNVLFNKRHFMFFGSKVEALARIVIREEGPNACKVWIYGTSSFNWISPMNLIYRRVFGLFQLLVFRKQGASLQKAVNRLGKEGQIGKAINLYGKLKVVDAVPPLEPKTCKVGVRIVFHYLVFEPAISCIAWVVKLLTSLFNCFTNIFGKITAQKFLLFVIAISVCLNFFLVSTTSVSYWKARQAHTLSTQMFMGDPVMLQRAVFLKDLAEITLFDHQTSAVSDIETPKTLEFFKKASFIRNIGHYVDFEEEYLDEDTREVVMGLKKTYEEIGIKRNKLLVDFNILNEIEKEVARGEFRNWLVNELRKCEMVQKDWFTISLNTTADQLTQLKEYCSMCESDFSNLNL